MKIENCKIHYRCPNTWGALLETADEKVRYCNACDRGVHLCNNLAELRSANEKGWCVAIKLEDHAVRKRQKADLWQGEIPLGYITAPYLVDEENLD